MSNGLSNAFDLLEGQVVRQLIAAVEVFGEKTEFSSSNLLKLHGKNLPVIEMGSGRTLAYASEICLYDNEGYQYDFSYLTKNQGTNEFFGLMDILNATWKKNESYVALCPFRVGEDFLYADIVSRAELINAEIEDFGRDVIGENIISVIHDERDLTYTFVLSGANVNGYVYRVISVD